MKMNFSKDELAMVYQYAAGTKEETLAGLKEIVPVIRDRQTREIVESTIRKLDAIRSRSAAALSLIRSSGLSRSGTIPSGAGLPKPRHKRGRKSHIPRKKSQTGNGHNRFQSRSPWTAPLKEGATIHHLKVVCCALPGASCGKPMIARSVPAPVNHHRGSYTSPALAAASYPFVDLPPGNTLRCKLFPFSKFNLSCYPSSGQPDPNFQN